MPIKKSAIKALRQAKKRTQRNRAIKTELNYLIKKSRQAIKNNASDQAKEFVYKACKALDKAAQKKVIKKNTAARKKSRLMNAYNKLIH